MPPRSLRRTAAALVVATVTTATLATAVAPAVARTADDGAPATGTAPTGTAATGTAASASTGTAAADSPRAVPGRYRGEVVARTGLILRDKPTRASRDIGELPYGAIVRIFCKVEGGSVDGNDHWYLLADGSYAWASARYIRSLDEIPHWC
ncbi:SH3 domain-containing protein [Streptomyces sp. JV176]|uniref:SH3 domain-containing protein n=1 Tax=Streptomyces sp. JV176 TaxID=858630 RepID=UPI002E7A5614|nr:SH3 domain-containing protein [Streptomyces sp. JV176]MEE1804593.1 SH3 domain-containing protein [Streptomyces sp. JV176]